MLGCAVARGAPQQDGPSGSPVRDRAWRLAALAGTSYDLLVVGGGVTGAGIARDAALRGLKTALVDRKDWGWGTSSRSSKLVHGGLRYLENFELGLVFEATRERAILRRLHPHLVWPLPFVFPVFEGDRNPLWKVNLGLWLYDLLSLLRGYRLHARWSARRTSAEVPDLRREGLTGALHYFDCRTDDARLALANALDAERHGATAASYVSYEGPVFEGAGEEEERMRGARVRCELSGEELELSCRHVVYAGGPWTDALPEAPGGGHLLRPTKGVHIVVDHARLPVPAAIVLSAMEDGRVVFAIPHEDATYIGTTDTDFDGDIDGAHASSDDVAYLLETTNHFFPEVGLGPEDVRTTWAGIRPLIRSDAESAYRTSREHQIYRDPRGLTTIAGGKLTTFRSMAEEVVDVVADALAGEGGIEIGRCRTARLALDPGVREVADPVLGPEDPFERCLWRHHGSGAARVRARLESEPAEGARLDPALPYVLAQVTEAVVHEHALCLEDVLVRRLHVWHRAADQGLGCADLVARHMAALLEKDEGWVGEEVGAYRRAAERARQGARALAAASVDTGEGAEDPEPLSIVGAADTPPDTRARDRA